MQNVLSQLEPKDVFHYFEEICSIPHGSRNTKKISDYCVEFAKANHLSYRQDEWNNIIIIKEATKGRENDVGVIIQGHLDMVTEKLTGSLHDFDINPLKLKVTGDFVCAEDTTLGADDGIAVAYALAVLASDRISHPRLEVVLTVDEEIGMIGASLIDLSDIKGNYLLNIDSEEEGILLSGCAGGMTSICTLPVRFHMQNGTKLRIEVTGLKGGHSGMEIDKERANANLLMSRIIFELRKEQMLHLSLLKGGLKDNAIVRESVAEIVIDPSEEQKIVTLINLIESVIKNEYRITDPDIKVNCEVIGTGEYSVLVPVDFEKVHYFLMQLPNGVQNWSADIPGLVETSLNIGILEITDEEFRSVSSIRSSVKSRKNALSDKVQYLIEFLGGEYDTTGVYPEWEFNPNSKLREVMLETYRDMFGEEAKVEAIHAGLECGYFLEKCPDLDVVSFGPNMSGIHTTEEKLSISSVQRTYDYLIELLKRLK